MGSCSSPTRQFAFSKTGSSRPPWTTRLTHSLLQGGLTLKNPYKSVAITYKMLMTHTSTLLDTIFDTSTATTPNTVGTLPLFVEKYLVSSSGSLITTVFSNNEPGTATAYSFARINIALMAYILEKVITINGLAYASLADYIAQEVLQPMGMSSTFWLLTDGSAPGIVTAPSFSGAYTSVSSSITSAYSPFFSGCIIDQFSSTRSIHPAFYADYMGYTTVGDMLRFARALLIDTSFATVASLMKETLTVASGVARDAQSGQGLGLMFFDGALMCQSALTAKAISSCPLTNRSQVVGYMSSRRNTALGFACYTTTAYGVVCAASAQVFASSTSRSYTSVMAMVSSVLQELVGSVTVATKPPEPPRRDSDEEKLFGVYVILTTYGSVMFVIFLTAFLQYLLLPASLAANATTANVDALPGVEPVGPRKAKSPRLSGMDD